MHKTFALELSARLVKTNTGQSPSIGLPMGIALGTAPDKGVHTTPIYQTFFLANITNMTGASVLV
jgi:hypothetical protein